MGEGEILRLKMVNISKHISLGMIAVPDRLRQDRSRPREMSGNGGRVDSGEVLSGRNFTEGSGRRSGSGDAELVGEVDDGISSEGSELLAGGGGGVDGDENVEEIDNIFERVRFVERDSDVVVVHLSQIDAVSRSLLMDESSSDSAESNRESVEESFVDDGVTELLDGSLDESGETVDLVGDLSNSLRTVVDGVHGGDVGEESLSGTDVGRSGSSSNVLLSSLQGESVSGIPFGVLRETDESSRHSSLQHIGASEEGGGRSSSSHRTTHSRRVPDGDVGSPLSRRLEDSEGEEIGSAGDESTESVRSISDALPVRYVSSQSRVLQEDSDQVLLVLSVASFGEHLLDVSDDDLDSERRSSSLDDGDGLREDSTIDEEGVLCALEMSERHDHRFSSGRSFVEERCVGDVETGEGSGETLEVDEGFQST